MHQKIREQNHERVQPFLNRLERDAVLETVPLRARFRRSKEPIPFDDRLEGDFETAVKGDVWGDAWDSAWFHLTAEIPREWKGGAVAARVELNGEALIFDESGCPVYGLSGGSIFIPNYRKERYAITAACEGGEEIELWIEAAANNIMGVAGSPASGDPGEGADYKGRVNEIALERWDPATRALRLDVEVLASLLNGLADGPRKNRVLKTLNEMFDAYLSERADASACREMLKPLWTPANASDLKVTGVGHAHIDTGWLWPVRESVRKCARTFASQIALIEAYPDYVFGASQPQHYQFVKDHYPALYEKIKAAVKAGRWELQGGMWVEADCNIISGESMVRQFIHGKNFFKDEFGEDVRNLWLPDVFGYSAAMPQVLRKCGVDFFMTQKISWNQFNTFPFHLFNWKGVDGTEIVTHFLPEDNYNSKVGPEALSEAQRRFNENDRCDEFVSLFGIGDGGGGPTEEMMERGNRMRDLEGCPKWRPGRADEAFERMRALSDELTTWSGELYLELHRGTLTSQAWIKKANRRLENKLRAVEFLYAALPWSDYPATELDRVWKLLLLNQFHDILPGSSIDLVYERAREEFADGLASCERMISAAAAKLFAADADALTLVNATSYERARAVTLPPTWAGRAVSTVAGEAIKTRTDGDRVEASVVISANGSLVLLKGEPRADLVEETAELVLENDEVRYEFDADGRLTRGYDKTANRELFAEPANVFTLYEDTPLNYDAWDVDVYYENMAIKRAVSAKPVRSTRGAVLDAIEFELTIGASTIHQRVALEKRGKRLDFETRVDWREEHRMLRVAFPTTIQTNESVCDIQYAHVKRPTHRNTSWDMAKFEVAAHKYVDLSDNGYGVALLNDCKYGFKTLGGTIDMNLLRSPRCPDPTADVGEHAFNYSLLPHAGALVESAVIAEAEALNHPPILAEGFRGESFQAPVEIRGEGVSMDVVKKAEKEDVLVIRLVERHGRESSAELRFANAAELIPTNLMEWVDEEPIEVNGPIELTLNPFEIATFKVR